MRRNSYLAWRRKAVPDLDFMPIDPFKALALDDARAELESFNVELFEMLQGILKCKECGTTWSPEMVNRELPVDYWHCPKGCNVKQAISPN